MYIFKCKGTWIYSGQYNLYLSSTLIKKTQFLLRCAGTLIKLSAMFSKSSLFKIEYSINIETQCLKNIQLYSKPHFHIFNRKKGPLPLLPESPSRSSGRGRGTGVLIFWKKDFFSKFLIWPSDLPRRRSSPKIAARGLYRLPSNNLTAYYNSQFFCKLSFWFWPGSPKMPPNVSELGLNIIQFISNLYVGVFL